jgi:hypothetical protein
VTTYGTTSRASASSAVDLVLTITGIQYSIYITIISSSYVVLVKILHLYNTGVIESDNKLLPLRIFAPYISIFIFFAGV